MHRATYKHLQRRITRGCWCKSPYFFTCRLLFLNARRKSAVYLMEKKIRHDLCRRWHPMNHIAKEMSNDTNRNYYWTIRLNVSPLRSPLIIWTSCYTLSSPFSIVQHSTNEDIETKIMTKIRNRYRRKCKYKIGNIYKMLYWRYQINIYRYWSFIYGFRFAIKWNGWFIFLHHKNNWILSW